MNVEKNTGKGINDNKSESNTENPYLIKQLSVFLENHPGHFNAFVKVSSELGIVPKIISISDTAEFGILRAIVSKPNEALIKLREAGYVVSIADVLAVSLEPNTETLYKTTEKFNANGYNIEYAYGYNIGFKGGILIMKIQDLSNNAINIENLGIQFIMKEAFDQ